MIGLQHSRSDTTLWLTADHKVLAKTAPRTLGGNSDGSGIPPHMRGRSRELRQNMSPPERKLWSALRNKQLGISFRRQHPIGPYIADFYAREAHLMGKQMIELQRKLHSEGKPYRAFDVYNLGRYERQWWKKDRLQGADEEHRRVILEFFQAEVLTNTPSPLLHGRKAGAFGHVDGIDSIFPRDEAKQVAQVGGRAIALPGSLRWICICW